MKKVSSCDSCSSDPFHCQTKCTQYLANHHDKREKVLNRKWSKTYNFDAGWLNHRKRRKKILLIYNYTNQLHISTQILENKYVQFDGKYEILLHKKPDNLFFLLQMNVTSDNRNIHTQKMTPSYFFAIH